MTDGRVAEQAKIIANYSCEIKPHDYVVMAISGAEGLPLVRELAGEIGRKGAHYRVVLQDLSIDRAYLIAADDETLSDLPSQIKSEFEALDVYIRIIASSNTQEMSDVPPSKVKANSKSMMNLYPIILKKRWNITLHPTPALAQEAKKSYESYCDFVYKAILRNWNRFGQEMRVLADKMGKAKRVRIIGKETDISFSIEGRKAIVDDAKVNLPGGEVFTSPVEDSVNGRVYFDLPFNYMGQEIKSVRLVYKNGQIVEHTAELGGQLLDQLFSSDEGARRLGELGIGMNRGINEPSKNVLFDEKMGDTIHMAVGFGFEEAGGRNKSAIHIDMIKSMKEEGAIYFDEYPIYKEGRFDWE
jgi:aminopeptidase